MKKIFLLMLLISCLSFSQIHKPVTWETSVKKITETEYLLIFTAMIKKDWVLYSMNLPEDGPLPTVFSFDKNADIQLLGKTTEEKGMSKYEEVFKMNVTYFKDKTTFKQRIKTSKKDFKISGVIDYMACNKEGCVPDYYEFEIEI
ncbi:protein-disulfide reductase DsbD family protein [Wenyingzhuangia sp. chi5]|uniref:Protein-disulfide reductase DsbD family protein n=1 Tax=Wenyingzhuangia gilva TaxID=3057677 RepID=A0ABT8VSW5_9FLAO|nr:protein-disulfide reductase DsbD domain-containing protein [Wenyingzhuangia sp. chi5]MDO3695073.1 protein-disulfide reductase DsbD family protein [Wenyingzhuangia sp. chi5]